MRHFVLLVVFVVIAAALPGQDNDSPSLLRITPTTTLGWPLGDDFSQLYTRRSGYGVQMSSIRAGKPLVGWLLSAEYRNTTLNDGAQTNLQIVRPEAGLRFRGLLGDRGAVFVQGLVGFGGARLVPAPADLAATTASGFTYRAGVGAELVLGSVYGFVDLSWDSFLILYNGISGRIGLGLQLGGRGVSGTAERRQVVPQTPQPLEGTGFVDLGFNFNVAPVFPVLYKYYDNEPIGFVTLTNSGDSVAHDVEIRLDMASYIDNPKLSVTIPELSPGEAVEAPLFALFNEGVRSITEGDKVAAVVSANYRVGTEARSSEETVTVEFYDRNAIQWDDNNKVAAFVTARDEQIRPLASNLAAIVRENRRDAVSSNFQLGLMMYLSMVEQGLAYSFDPTSSYEVRSQDALVVDSVQFPRQTFAYRGGDCDDLSVTYAALLESVAVPTAFVTIPGHIYLAFGLDMNAETARDTFAKPEDLIFRDDGSVWVPVEITLLEEGFTEAWHTGARQWREHNPEGRAGFYPTAEAWQTYQPVAYTGIEQVRPFDEALLESAFNREIVGFVKREIADRELALRSRLQRDPDDARVRNRLGVLYARYGLTDEAAAEFERAVASNSYAPAYANLGNIAFLNKDYQNAERLFELALSVDDRNSAALLGLARTNHELENYGLVRRYYDQLKESYPSIAVDFGYLELRGEEAERASDAASLAGRVHWEEEGE